MPKFVFLHHCYIAFGSRSKVIGHGSRSSFWHTVVDIRGSALPSAAMNNNQQYQSKVDCLFVCYQWAFADNRVDAVDRLLIIDMHPVSLKAFCSSSEIIHV